MNVYADGVAVDVARHSQSRVDLAHAMCSALSVLCCSVTSWGLNMHASAVLALQLRMA